MPIPNPKAGETQQQYIARCYKEIKDEYPTAQSFAICYSKYKEKK
jgi:hypothetical protein